MRTEDGLTAAYPEEDMVLSLVLTEDTAYVQKAQVSVDDQEGNEIYAIEIAWQKEGQS